MKTDQQTQLQPADPRWRVGIIYSNFYEEEMVSMVGAAQSTLLAAGINEQNMYTYPVAGAWEIPLVGRRLTEHRTVDALIGLGIVVEGETHHARLVAENSAQGMMDVQTKYGMPFINEVLYTDTLELAQQRLHKGGDAARTALDSLALLARLQS